MSEREAMMNAAVAAWYDGITRRLTDRQIVGAVVGVAIAARDAEWRAAVERVREENCGPRTATLSAPVHSALDTLLAAMEAK